MNRIPTAFDRHPFGFLLYKNNAGKICVLLMLILLELPKVYALQTVVRSLQAFLRLLTEMPPSKYLK